MAAARRLRRGERLVDVAGNDWVDAAGAPGLVVLDRRWSLISPSSPQFHADLLWTVLSGSAELGDSNWSVYLRSADEALTLTWAFAGILDSQRYELVRRADQQLRFVSAARQHWVSLTSLGSRFSTGGEGRRLEDLPSLVTFCLARQGAPVSELQPLTAQQLEQLASSLPGFRMRELAREGKLQDAAALLKDHREIALVSLAEHLVDFGYDDVACQAVENVASPDPHAIVRRWLDGRGNAERSVR